MGHVRYQIRAFFTCLRTRLFVCTMLIISTVQKSGGNLSQELVTLLYPEDNRTVERLERKLAYLTEFCFSRKIQRVLMYKISRRTMNSSSA